MNDSPEWNATATEIEGFSCANWGCDHHECRHLRVAAAGLRRYADVWLFPPSGPEDDDLDRTAANLGINLSRDESSAADELAQ